MISICQSFNTLTSKTVDNYAYGGVTIVWTKNPYAVTYTTLTNLTHAGMFNRGKMKPKVISKPDRHVT